MDEYILYLDETAKSTCNPYFCLAGIIVKRKDYEDNVIPQINVLKKKYFSTTDIIFHASAMNRKEKEFNIFKDNIVNRNFWNEYVTLINIFPFTTLGVYFDQAQMSSLFKTNQINFYNIAFVEIIRNYIHFLKENNGIGSIIIESRSFRQNAALQNDYYQFIKNGSWFYSAEDFQKHLSSLGFIVKKDNCIGLQVADFCPLALTKVLNARKDSFNLGKTYYNKLYKISTPELELLGLKKIQ
jgi:hypothetical protein